MIIIFLSILLFSSCFSHHNLYTELMVILDKWPSNTNFRLHQGYLGQLVMFLGKWPYTSNTYFKLHRGYLGQQVIILEQWLYNTYFSLHQAYLWQLVVILGNWPYNTYFRVLQGYLGQLVVIWGKMWQLWLLIPSAPTCDNCNMWSTKWDNLDKQCQLWPHVTSHSKLN